MISRRFRITGGLVPLLILVATALGMYAASPTSGSEASKRRAAARHYYLSAARKSAVGDNASAAELYKKAYQIDSTYSEAALQYGVRRLGMPSDTLSTPAERQTSKLIASKFMKEYPGDFFPNIFLSNILERHNDFEGSIAILETLNGVDPGNTDVLQHLAALYLDSHQFDKAMKAIADYERIEGESIETLIRKTGMMLAMGDTTGAIAATDRMIELNPTNTQYVVFKGQLYSYINQPDSALKTLQYAESLEKPGYGGPVKIQLADYYRNEGDSVMYDAKIYEALLSEDLDFEVKKDVLLYYLQTIIQDNADRSRGDKLFTELRSQYPHEPDLLALSARYSASKSDFAKAAEDMGYALDMDHTNAEYWEQAMLYAIMLDDNAGADALFQRARAALRKVPMRLYSLAGSNAMMTDDYDKALQLYQICLDENFPGQELSRTTDMQALGTFLTLDNISDLINIYQEAGDAYYKKGMRKESFINYENALALDPDNALSLNNYAYFLVEDATPVEEEDMQKADEMSLRAISLAPDNPVYLDTRAWVLFRKGEYKEARELEERALENLSESTEPDDRAEYEGHLGDILFMLGQPEEAVAEWKKALENRPDDELLKKKVKNRAFYYE